MRYLRLFLNLSNWWLYLAVKLGLTHADPLLFKARGQVRVEVPRRLLHEFKEIFMESCYLRGLGLSVPQRPTVIDIGANVGFFTVFAASRFPGAKIFAYEPMAYNFRQLERNCALNRHVPMHCFQKAVCAFTGQTRIRFDPNDSLTTTASIFNTSDILSETVQVPCVALPDIFKANHLDRCDLLKMDCEGAEYDILYNCPAEYLDKISQMVIEVHGGSQKKENMASLAAYLRSHDFHTRLYDLAMLAAWRRSRPR